MLRNSDKSFPYWVNMLLLLDNRHPCLEGFKIFGQNEAIQTFFVQIFFWTGNFILIPNLHQTLSGNGNQKSFRCLREKTKSLDHITKSLGHNFCLLRLRLTVRILSSKLPPLRRCIPIQEGPS